MRLSVLGAGPHGHEIQWMLLADDRIDPHLYDDHIGTLPATYEAPLSAPYVIGAAWPHVRQQIAAKADRLAPWRGDGHLLFPGARRGHGVTFGQHVHVLHNAVVSHGCHLGDFVTVCAGAVLAGEVTVEAGATIGANATVRHGGIVIGEGAFVGAGAVVVEDVAPGAVVVGAPARELVKVPV